MLMRMYTRHLSDKNIKFSFDKNKNNILVYGDENQLYRVFLNLIKNSMESINEKRLKIPDIKGKIDVEIVSNSTYICINLTDNGVGFESVNIKKITAPYFTTKKNGTGLGLSIVTKIISDHDGQINFQNNKNGAKVEIIFQRDKIDE